MNQPPRWTQDQLRSGLETARRLFREERIREPLEAYMRAFDQSREAVIALLDETDSLSSLADKSIEVLTKPDLLEAFRYLAGPPISRDDLTVLADAQLSASRLRGDPAMARRVFEIVRATIDARRFPWVAEQRQPTVAERHAAVIASAALVAFNRVGADRRSEGRERQEKAVREGLATRGLKMVPTRTVTTFNLAPGPGEFCRESLLGTTRADFLVGLRDRRLMAIECKVSNSAINSVKRLNREVAGKAEYWVKEFGARNVVPAGVLSGVFKLHNLENAQERVLTIFWSHHLNELFDWIEMAR